MSAHSCGFALRCGSFSHDGSRKADLKTLESSAKTKRAVYLGALLGGPIGMSGYWLLLAPLDLILLYQFQLCQPSAHF